MPSHFSRKRRCQLFRRRSICSSLPTVRRHKTQVIRRTRPAARARSHSARRWSSSVKASRSTSWQRKGRRAEHASPVRLSLGATTELGRFPAIPYELVGTRDGMRRAPAVVEAHERAKQRLQAEVARRLASAPRKEVVLFVHGYHASFESAALTMGEMCHFLGREFVCGIFSWPAGGHGGILFGYDVDRESAEYAVEDLVKVIRIIAGTPGLERIHFVAHSRGTDTLASALAVAERRGLRPKELADARVPHRQRRARRSRPRRRRRGDEDFQSLLRSRPAFRRGTRSQAQSSRRRRASG